MIKTLIVAASILTFSGAVMATEVPKTAAKAKCVASSTVKCPVETTKKPEAKKSN
jgi:hypothetical protein